MNERDRADVSKRDDIWVPLPLEEWREMLDTLQLWTQIVGKVKLELTPFLNEWWNVALHLTPLGSGAYWIRA